MKPCDECGVFKPLEDFSPNYRYADGRLPKCKPCNAARAMRARRAAGINAKRPWFETFYDRVAPANERGCHVWTGARAGTHGEYGLTWNGQRPEMAHRVAYRLANGEIPEGLVIDHLCRRTLCVNPAHLEAVTTKENVARGYSANVAAGRDRK